METVDGNERTNETLGGVSSSFPPNDDSHKILKPSLEERVGEDLGPENEVLGGGSGGGSTVVVTTTVVEKIEVSVVEKIQEGKKDEILKKQEEGFEKSVEEKKEGFEVQENEKKGFFGNLVGDGDENMVFVDAKGSFSRESISEENAGGDPMEVEKQENGAEFFESVQDKDKNAERNAGEEKKPTNVYKSYSKSRIQENGQDSGNELAENEEEEDEIEDHDFVVGDFVWGKIKSHPWWPGQIYDPSDASDYAATLQRKGHLLVAYFGDGSFSWCSPSQLKLFIESFEEMSNQSDSKKFVNAVQKALEAVSRLVEAEMMCKCRTVNRDRVSDGFTVNSGIKAGVGMPKGNTIKVLIDRMNPVELLSTLQVSATMEPGSKMADLELTVLKSCLTAFYRQKGGQSLPEYHDPEYIEGLEADSRSGVVADSDMNGPSESSDGKSYQKRKQKSVAELLGEGVEDDCKIKKTKTSSGGGSGSRRKRKALVVSVLPESDHDSGGGGGGLEEETMSPRQRKKSKYLSPPYTSPIWSGKLTGSFKEVKSEVEKVPEMAAKHIEDSMKRSSGRKSNHKDSKIEEQKMMIIDAAVNVNKVLDGLLRAALNPSSFVEKKKLPEVSEFVWAFRSSVFEEGSKHKTGGRKPISDLEFIEEKLVLMREMVKRCEEGEMSDEMKSNLEGGIKEVLEKVGKMRKK